ncbi:cytochrome P450 [Rhizorhabdus argentea]|uniref:cytochrome P450 n=1 Tax=Rhizorhabdus argentea TaxID=1387174 RepID=UPI0030ED4C24
MTDTYAQPPANVPPELVVDFDYINPPGSGEVEITEAWSRIHDRPDIFWTPRNGGHWVVTRAEDIRWVQANHRIFSHEIFVIPRLKEPLVAPPMSIDPPDHVRYRSMINPALTPGQVKKISVGAREKAISLVENIKPNGRCNFVAEFAMDMPISIFLQIIELPLSERDMFVGWANRFIHTFDEEVKNEYYGKITAYLSAVAEERCGKGGTDLISRVAEGKKDGRFRTDEEVAGMLLLIFVAGLDTVANMMSFIMRHLAMHPDHRKRLIDDPAIIPHAVEEYLRRFGLSSTGRLIKEDVTYKGVTFAEDQMILVPLPLSGLDERMYDEPLKIDFDRPNRADHNTFGTGPHRCPGATLARAEIAIMLEEWLARIPDFRLTPGAPHKSHSGTQTRLGELHIEWDV